MESKPDKEAEVYEAVRTLAEIHNRPLSDQAMVTWVDHLLPLHGPELLHVLKGACREPRMPGLGEIFQTTQSALRRKTEIAAAKIDFDAMVASAQTPEAKTAAEECLRILRDKFGLGPQVMK